MKATARPSPSAITHALVPEPPRERPSASRSSRPLLVAPFFRARRLVVSPNAGAVQKRHPELNPTLLGQEQQPLPHAQGGPADEGLSRSRPGTKLSRDARLGIWMNGWEGLFLAVRRMGCFRAGCEFGT